RTSLPCSTPTTRAASAEARAHPRRSFERTGPLHSVDPMQAVNERIQLHLGELLAHPFLAEMKPHPELSRAMAFAEVLAPWVLTFQDLIRINATRARDPEVRKVLAQHAKEDRGHEAWFLEDLDVIFGPRVRDLRWLYSPE